MFVYLKILDAMNRDCGIPLSHLQVDGGMTNNKILMQLQADILYIPVGKSLKLSNTFFARQFVFLPVSLQRYWLGSLPSVKPSMPETTALGAAMAAGAAEGVGVWSLDPEDLSAVTVERFEPQINAEGTVEEWNFLRVCEKDLSDKEVAYLYWQCKELNSIQACSFRYSC